MEEWIEVGKRTKETCVENCQIREEGRRYYKTPDGKTCRVTKRDLLHVQEITFRKGTENRRMEKNRKENKRDLRGKLSRTERGNSKTPGGKACSHQDESFTCAEDNVQERHRKWKNEEKQKGE